VTGTGLTDIPTYQADNGGGNSNYENIQSTINYEVNRIQTDIVKSPYRLEDLNINVGIEPPDPANPASLDAQTQQAIRSMLANIVRTALADKQTVITNQDAMDRVVVIPRQFDGKPTVPNATKPAWWIYALIGLAALAIGGAAGWAIRRRKADEREIIPNDLTIPAIDQPREQSKGDLIKQDLEKLARQRPEDFASLLRTWLVDE
jgi:flagellar M-ring protein FliF